MFDGSIPYVPVSNIIRIFIKQATLYRFIHSYNSKTAQLHTVYMNTVYLFIIDCLYIIHGVLVHFVCYLVLSELSCHKSDDCIKLSYKPTTLSHLPPRHVITSCPVCLLRPRINKHR
mgnify:CR=1 FL=1